MIGAPGWAFLFLAGVVGGIVGTAGGITSLVAYPALLAVGIPPFTANVTNAVALLGSGLGSSLQSRLELAGHGRTLRRWMPLAVVFSLAGAILLVTTPASVFDRIVPFLVATGALVLLLQPQIAAWQSRRGHAVGTLAAGAFGAGVALYNGYFGAGSGILMIALLMLTTEPVLQRANALKNVILVAADVLPAVVFVLTGTVLWSAVWPLGVGALVGGLIGPPVARRIRPDVLRILVAVCGFALALWLLIRL
ncbi:sulfite exporter TauE/SafE family protein [Gryllotalpicola sp.]|uniref:sulfite exporter TauE/SafE family protein n=1 Tax=Gryllotalpicola sp. TaxID=1932787 RepID=UPI00262159BD|nr:sulfite exporter TauE/SafE family protein [Gryllotalpicola sp.]